MDQGQPDPPRTRWAVVALVAVLALGAGLRLVYTSGALFAGGEYAHDIDPDIHYHLHRLDYAAANGGAPLVDDRFAAGGLRCPWPVVFDALALGLARLLPLPAHAALTWAAGLLPLLLGLAAAALAFVLLRSRAGPWPALAGAAFFAASREALSVSAFGMFDHHALELVVCIAMVGLAMTARGRRAFAFGALATGCGLLAADAAYFAVAAFGLVSLLRRDEDWVRFTFGGVAGAVLASLLELALHLPRALPATGRVGLTLLVAAVALRRRRALLPAAAGAALAAPMLWTAGGYLTASGDPVSPIIFQSQPMWAAAPLPTLLQALVLTALAAGFALRKGRDEAPLAALAVLGGVLALVQVKYRFLLAWTGAWSLAHLAARFESRRAVLAAALLLYLGGRTATELADAPPGPDPRDEAFAALAAWMRANTPPQDPLAKSATPDWTVAVRPEQGPRTERLAARAVTAVPFWGDAGPREALTTTLRALLDPDESDAVALLAKLKARYVLLDDLSGYADAYATAAGVPALPTAVAVRLFATAGSATPATPALARFRLVADTGAWRLFEVVPGARLEGTTLPGGRVVLAADVHPALGAPAAWFSPAEADATGHFSLVTPYPGRLMCAGGEVPVDVPDAAIRDGRSVPVHCP